ncbi:MAG: hypothetical protein KJZ93_09925 [Caldilineaceae bacterium]|nr:hypothetical protein [Caldilineaceae bacterium]
MYKVFISYNMQAGKEQECQEYLINKLAPGLARMGFRIADVWYTIWGKSPQILSGGMIEDLEQAQRIFGSDSWEQLAQGMQALTEDFHVRVVKSRDDQFNIN